LPTQLFSTLLIGVTFSPADIGPTAVPFPPFRQRTRSLMYPVFSLKFFLLAFLSPLPTRLRLHLPRSSMRGVMSRPPPVRRPKILEFSPASSSDRVLTSSLYMFFPLTTFSAQFSPQAPLTRTTFYRSNFFTFGSAKCVGRLAFRSLVVHWHFSFTFVEAPSRSPQNTLFFCT